jgi:hypothetical protein
MASTPKKSPRQRGYGSGHFNRRKAIEAAVNSGMARCARCAQRIQPGERWHLDHDDTRTGYLGASHAKCNLVAAGQKRQQLRREQEAAQREAERAAGYVPGRIRRWSRVWSTVDPPPNVEIKGLPLDEYLAKFGDGTDTDNDDPHIF